MLEQSRTTHQRLQEWMHDTIRAHSTSLYGCETFETSFRGYFANSFLKQCSYVITDQLPYPYHILPQEEFKDLADRAVTFQNCYYIRPEYADNFAVHIHQLVHCMQWMLMQEWFVSEYLSQILSYGHQDAPIEQDAAFIEANWLANDAPIDVHQLVLSHL